MYTGLHISGDSPALQSMTAHYLDDGDPGARQTVDDMRALVDRALKNPRVYVLARRLVQDVPAYDQMSEARAIYEWVRANIRFVMGTIGKQSLQTAESTLALRAGQCTDLSILLAGLLMSIGYPVRFVAIAADPGAPDQLSHIYPEAQLNGEWIPVDAARENAQFGVPPQRLFRDETFNILDDTGNMPRLGLGQGTLDTVLQNLPSIEYGAADIVAATQPQPPILVQSGPSLGTLLFWGAGALLLYAVMKKQWMER